MITTGSRFTNCDVNLDDQYIRGDGNNIKGKRCTVVGDGNVIYGDECVIEGVDNIIYGKGCTFGPGNTDLSRSGTDASSHSRARSRSRAAPSSSRQRPATERKNARSRSRSPPAAASAPRREEKKVYGSRGRTRSPVRRTRTSRTVTTTSTSQSTPLTMFAPFAPYLAAAGIGLALPTIITHTRAALDPFGPLLEAGTDDFLAQLGAMTPVSSPTAASSRARRSTVDHPLVIPEPSSSSASSDRKTRSASAAPTTPLCVICTERSVQVMYDCGHLITCITCSNKLVREQNAKCPNCRAVIQRATQAFMP